VLETVNLLKQTEKKRCIKHISVKLFNAYKKAFFFYLCIRFFVIFQILF